MEILYMNSTPVTNMATTAFAVPIAAREVDYVLCSPQSEMSPLRDHRHRELAKLICDCH